jgi:hypothetical protein
MLPVFPTMHVAVKPGGIENPNWSPRLLPTPRMKKQKAIMQKGWSDIFIYSCEDKVSSHLLGLSP